MKCVELFPYSFIHTYIRTCIMILYDISSLHVEVPLPSVTAIQPKSNAVKYNVEHTPNMECYSQHTFQYHAVWYPVINGVPDVTQLQNDTFPFSDTVMIDGLMSDTEYKVNITAECVEIEDVVSDPLSMGITTVSEYIHMYYILKYYINLYYVEYNESFNLMCISIIRTCR